MPVLQPARPPTGEAGHRISVTLPHDLRAPRLARVALQELLAANGWPQSVDSDIVLSELVAHAVKDGKGTSVLRVELSAGRIQGSLTYDGAALEASEHPGARDSKVDFSLQIIEALADRVGLYEAGGRVWFELAVVR